MSATQQTTNPEIDRYLAEQKAPPQGIKLDPQFKSIRMVTPIGRSSYANLIKPKSVQAGNKPIYSITLLMNPESCSDLWKAICMIADDRWPSENIPNPQAPGELVTVRGSQLLLLTKEQGGIHNPLRRGDATWAKDPKKYAAYRGAYALNLGIAAVNEKTGASQQPPVFDESNHLCAPDKVYSGCYVRAQVTFFSFPTPGKQVLNRGIGAVLNCVQFARNGEKLAGYDVAGAGQAAFAAAGPFPAEAQSPVPDGFGPNFGAPWAAGTPNGGQAPAWPLMGGSPAGNGPGPQPQPQQTQQPQPQAGAGPAQQPAWPPQQTGQWPPR